MAPSELQPARGKAVFMYWGNVGVSQRARTGAIPGQVSPPAAAGGKDCLPWACRSLGERTPGPREKASG